MQKEKLLKTDFASLRILQYAHDFGSFSQAADRLGITQSNVSYCIAGLREVFQDPLFAREGHVMVPTGRCTQIAQYAAGILEEFQEIAEASQFDPGTAENIITLSCNHYERMTIIPQLLQRLRSNAPRLRLRVLNSQGSGEDQLKRGECDLLFSPVQIEGEQIFKRRIRTDEYVCIADPSNPLAQASLTVPVLAGANHIVLRFTGGWRPYYLHTLEAMGIMIRPMVELNEYGDIANYVRGTDLVAVVPRRLADKMGDRLVKLDMPFPVPLSIDLFWTTRTNRAPSFSWFRNLIALIGHDETTELSFS